MFNVKHHPIYQPVQNGMSRFSGIIEVVSRKTVLYALSGNCVHYFLLSLIATIEISNVGFVTPNINDHKNVYSVRRTEVRLIV